MQENSEEQPDLDAGVSVVEGEVVSSNINYFVPSQKETGTKLQERQEQTRSQLATFLIKILAGMLIASFGLIALLIVMSVLVDADKEPVLIKNIALAKDLITFILTAQTGLIGTALGFYFGSKSGNSD